MKPRPRETLPSPTMIDDRMGTIGSTHGVNDSSNPNARKARPMRHTLPLCSVRCAKELSSSGGAPASAPAAAADDAMPFAVAADGGAAAVTAGAAPAAGSAGALDGEGGAPALAADAATCSGVADCSLPGAAGSTANDIVAGA